MRRDAYQLRLYIAGDAQNSLEALANLAVIRRTGFPEDHIVEVIDVLQDPSRALADRIFMTPTLVKIAPLPMRTIVGTLADADAVRMALGLNVVSA